MSDNSGSRTFTKVPLLLPHEVFAEELARNPAPWKHAQQSLQTTTWLEHDVVKNFGIEASYPAGLFVDAVQLTRPASI
jgi:hypothetical protein